MHVPDLIRIDPRDPDPSLIRRAVHILRQGGVIAYPTETFYALGADCFQEAALDRIFHIKGRTFNNPLALIGGRKDDLQRIADGIPAVAEGLMKAFWPGPLTLLFPAADQLSLRLTAKTGKIGIRISSHPVAHALALAMGGPLTATSANRSGERECIRAAEVVDQIGEHLDLVIDGGITTGGKGSSIVDTTTDPPVILREGAIAAAAIRQIIQAGPS
jgi:L-threonylcarbamoyladenylate synthase